MTTDTRSLSEYARRPLEAACSAEYFVALRSQRYGVARAYRAQPRAPISSVRRAWRVTRRCESAGGLCDEKLLAERQLRDRKVAWEGSRGQSSDPRNTKRIGGEHRMGEGADRPEACRHTDAVSVDATGAWSESYANYPGRAGILPRG